MTDYKRLTTNNPKNNMDNLLNYAYVNNKDVYLRYANGEDYKRLVDYIAELATQKGCARTADDIMDESCGECDCEVEILNIVAIQAAELRSRLCDIEDKIESGELGDTKQAVKEFAERLKSMFGQSMQYGTVRRCIDELVKEYEK